MATCPKNAVTNAITYIVNDEQTTTVALIYFNMVNKAIPNLASPIMDAVCIGCIVLANKMMHDIPLHWLTAASLSRTLDIPEKMIIRAEWFAFEHLKNSLFVDSVQYDYMQKQLCVTKDKGNT